MFQGLFVRTFVNICLFRPQQENRLPNCSQACAIIWQFILNVKRKRQLLIRFEHIETLLGATCCVCLATVLQHVGCCWLKFETGQIWANNTPHVATYCNTVVKRMQHVAPSNVAICCVGMLAGALKAVWAKYVIMLDLRRQNYYFEMTHRCFN